MAKANLSKSQPAAPQKPVTMIPAVVVLSEVGNRLKKILSVLDSMDSMFAAIDGDQNPWAIGMSYIATGCREEIKDVKEYLGKMIIKGGSGGEALGIEKK